MSSYPCKIDFLDGAPKARCLTHNKVLSREPSSGFAMSSPSEVEQFVCPIGGGQAVVPKVPKSGSGMTSYEMLDLSYGQDTVNKAREIAGHCETGHFVFVDRKNGRVFYRDAHSTKTIPTDFTKEHVEIAWHSFHPSDPFRISWDQLNSDASDGKFDVYTVKGK